MDKIRIAQLVAIVIAILASILFSVSSAAADTDILSGDPSVWGNETDSGTAHLLKYAFPAGGIVDNFVPSAEINQNPFFPTANGRGLAVSGGDAWYSFVNGSFRGDGYIHVVPICPGALGRVCPDLLAIPEPGGFGGPGIGALDVSGKSLWAISYCPVAGTGPLCSFANVGGLNTIYEFPLFGGPPVASCTVPFLGGGIGVDTLEVNPKTGALLTDEGELTTTTPGVLHTFLPPAIGSFGAACVADGPAITTTINGVPGVTGVDFFGTLLFGSNLFSSICADIRAPATSQTCIGTAGHLIEDISVVK